MAYIFSKFSRIKDCSYCNFDNNYSLGNSGSPLSQILSYAIMYYNLYNLLCDVRIGRKSPRLVRAAALKLAEELLEMVIRPSFAMVTRCQEG